MRRFVIELGTGVDQHGQDNTRAAEKSRPGCHPSQLSLRDARGRRYQKPR